MNLCINGDEMAYDDVGSGPAVVLIHGFPLSRQMWRLQAAALVENGYRVIAPDLRGFGTSALGNGRPNFRTYADDISTLLTYLGIGRAVLVGISKACSIVIDMLERYPRRVAATCFLSPPLQPGDTTERVRSLDLAELVREGYRQSAIDNLCEQYLPDQQESSVRTLTAEVRGWMEQAHPEALAETLAARPKRLALREVTAPYAVPTLVLNGSRDRLMPLDQQRASLDGVWETVQGAGHLLNLEAAEQVNRHLLGFLQGLSTVKLRHHRLAKVA